MGRRKNRRKPTLRQKMESGVDTRRALNPDAKPRMVACGVIRKREGAEVSSVTRVDFGHFSRAASSSSSSDGGDGLPSLDAMSDLGRKVVISIATRMRLTPQEIIARVSG